MFMIYNNNTAAPRLGNIAQSSSLKRFEGEKNYKRVAKRRFALHRLQSELLPDEKALASCSLHAAPHASISGNYCQNSQQAFFGGLKHCDSPNCVLCAPRRAEEARRELTVLLAECQRRGYFVYHMTFTLSHTWQDSLAWEHEALQGALAETFSDSWWKKLMGEIGYVGRVRAFENPCGDNGWHLHAHIILITENGVIKDTFEKHVFKRYVRKLKNHGATASAEHGLKVNVGYSELADYVSKYGYDPIIDEGTSGLESEIASFRMKKGRNGSLTPFELLAAAHGETEPLQKLTITTGSRYSEAQCMTLAAELFIEHFDTMKGKPRLVWSTGLWKKMDMDTALDWYNAEQVQPEPEILFDLEPQGGWKMVRGDGKTTEDLRGELLTELASGNYARLRAWFVRMKIPVILYPMRDGGKCGIGERLNPLPLN